jgi:hypothetical protein
MARTSFISELFAFVRAHKAYMLIPIVIMLLLAGLLIILGGTKAAPFIYSIF